LKFTNKIVYMLLPDIKNIPGRIAARKRGGGLSSNEDQRGRAGGATGQKVELQIQYVIHR
jgi:hypothetical protein